MCKLKTLGLALVAALALSALAATSAAAESFAFHSELQHTDLTGSAEGTHQFTVDGGTTTCTGLHLKGTVKAKEVSEVAVTPTYTECKTSGLTTHAAMASCKYVLTPETKSGSAYTAKLGIACEGADVLKFSVTLFGGVVCTVEVPPQVLGGIAVSEVGEGDVKVTIEVSNVEYDQTGGCGTAENTTNGTYEGTTVIAGSLGGEGVNVGMQAQTSAITMPPVTIFGKLGSKVKIKITNASGVDIKNGLVYKDASNGGPFVVGVKGQDGCEKGIPKGGSCEVEFECIKKIPVAEEAFLVARTLASDPRGTAATQLEGCT